MKLRLVDEKYPHEQEVISGLPAFQVSHNLIDFPLSAAIFAGRWDDVCVF